MNTDAVRPYLQTVLDAIPQDTLHLLKTTPVTDEGLTSLIDQLLDVDRLEGHLHRKLNITNVDLDYCVNHELVNVREFVYVVEETLEACYTDLTALIGRDYEAKLLFEEVFAQRNQEKTFGIFASTLSPEVFRASVELFETKELELHVNSEVHRALMADSPFEFTPDQDVRNVLGGRIGTIVFGDVNVDVFTDAFVHPLARYMGKNLAVFGEKDKWGVGSVHVECSTLPDNSQLTFCTGYNLTIGNRIVIIHDGAAYR